MMLKKYKMLTHRLMYNIPIKNFINYYNGKKVKKKIKYFSCIYRFTIFRSMRSIPTEILIDKKK